MKETLSHLRTVEEIEHTGISGLMEVLREEGIEKT
jgi:hypothetical protein